MLCAVRDANDDDDDQWVPLCCGLCCVHADEDDNDRWVPLCCVLLCAQKKWFSNDFQPQNAVSCRPMYRKLNKIMQ